MKTTNVRKLTIVAALLVTTLVISGCGRAMHGMMHRMDRMHGERFGRMHEFGEEMMPFGFGERGDRGEMVGVSHIFEPTDDGASYQVIAEDVEDAETVAMIQERLAQQVEEMNVGMDALSEGDEEGDGENDESDDSRQGREKDRERGRGLGAWMRGMGEFMDEIEVTYTDLPDGGEIAITSENAEVVEMIHGWIEDGPMGRN